MTKTDKRHERRGGFYWVQGTPYVSVTNVLKSISKPQLQYWFGKEVYLAMCKDPTLDQRTALNAPYATSDKAKTRGSTVHSVVEAYKNTGEEIDEVPKQFRGYVEAFYSWVKDNNVKIKENEKTVYSEKYGYAGTLDMLAEINESGLSVLDVKTSKGAAIYPEAELQVSAYIQALNEGGLEVKRGFVLALGETGKYNYKEIDYDFDTFLHVMALWKWQNKRKWEKYMADAESAKNRSGITNPTKGSSVNGDATKDIG